MGDANEGKRGIGRMKKLSLETNRNPRDLLQRFLATNQTQLISMTKQEEEEEEEEEELELNLGLSLGGRFGADKTDKKKLLMRSASVAAILPIVRDDGDAVAPPPVSYPAALIRTSSLPAESEEEWRKRKELQSLRRLEAKRRRSEKQRNSRGERDAGGENEVNLRGRSEREQYFAAGNRILPPFGLPSWAASVALHGASGGGGGGLGFVQSSGSIDSQGGSSSGMSESDSRPVQGSSSCGEASPSSIQSFQKRTNRERENACKSSAEMETPSRRPDAFPERRGKETGSNPADNMPCVFTQGDGPNGKRIDGILYRYGKGEEVRIMCVCHGSFLSPAEFVEHAGGTDVAHPLRHIVVNPSASTSLV